MSREAGHPQEQPLESWKEIAAYFKRDVRTVIRWEKCEGLPVHRQRHHVRSSVFAYASELEAWKARRELPADVALATTPWRCVSGAAGFSVAMLLALGTTGGGAALTRARAASGDGGPGIVFRQVRVPGLEETPSAQLSPDGKKMLYMRLKEGGRSASLRVVDLSSGQEQCLVDGFGARDPLSSFRWSPDGATIVYAHQGRELRVVDSHGGDSRFLWSASDPTAIVKPLDWARDGRSILVALVDETQRTMRLALLPAAGGDPRPVVSGRRGELEDWGTVSPDGRFTAGLRSDGGKTYICVWASDGDQEIRVTEPGTSASPAFWSPDGQYLVFISDRMKTLDLWALPMRDGRPRGVPYRVKQGLGRNALLTGFTPAGQLTLLVTGEGTPSDLFVLNVDRSTGEPRGELAAYARYPTDHLFPRWSPDGARVAYTSRKGQIRLPGLFVSTADGRSEEEIPMDDHYVPNVEWSPDGTQILFAGFRRTGKFGIFRISLESHEVTPLHLGGRRGSGHEGAFVNLQWLPLAGKFMFGKLSGEDITEIYTMDKDGRQVERVAEVPTSYWAWPSPDGRHLAYRQGQVLRLLTVADGTTVTLAAIPEGAMVSGPAWSPDARGIASSDTRRVLVLSPIEGTPRALVEAPEGCAIGGTSWSSGLAWAPDGRTIAYLQRQTPAEAGARSELWVVPAAGGTPRRVAVAPASHPLLSDVTWHPGGTMILATGGTGEQPKRVYEHWVMESFLPAP